VRESAPAKLNLFLRVVGRRPDGFHEIETLLQPLTLADGVEAAAADGEITLRVAGEYADQVPDGEENRVLRAARALAAAEGVSTGARLMLVKRVPVAAGLGGGSADAAATLRALDLLWDLGLGTDRLEEIGATIGSDVPGLISGGPMLARGRGETVEPANVLRTWWALVTPAVSVQAEEAYGWWDEYGGLVGKDPARLLAALREEDPAAVGSQLFNDLEGPVGAKVQEVRDARSALREAGALGVIMCGSGPAVAGLARDGRHAEELAATVGGTVVSSISRAPTG
jgi:4-diphosphocytidyl-2-C-methyl-D-erythritol kinase